MYRLLIGLTCALLLLVGIGCSGMADENKVAPNTAGPRTTTTAGQASVRGRVLSKRTSTPLKNTVVRLAEVYRQGNEGAFALDGARSPGGTTNNEGVFTIENIEAREYVLVVGDVEGQYEIIPDQTGKAHVWNAKAGEVVDVGDIEVNLPK